MIVGQKTEPDNLHVLLDVDGLLASIPILLTHAQLDKLLLLSPLPEALSRSSMLPGGRNFSI